MAFPLSALLIPAIIGVAVFAGFDPRKKKDKSAAQGGVPSGPDSEIRCVSTFRVSDDNQLVSIDGGPWISDGQWRDEIYALTQERPVVTLLLCQPDTVTLDGFEQMCSQLPEVAFFGLYTDQLGGAAKQQLRAICDQVGAVAIAVVNRITNGEPTAYNGLVNPELVLHPGDNIAEFFATILETIQDGGGLEGQPVLLEEDFE